MMRMTRWIGLAVAVCGLLAGEARATLVVYTDQAAWQAAAGTMTNETFNSSAPFNTTGAFGPNAYNGFSLSGDGNNNNIGIHAGVTADLSTNTPIPASFDGQNFFSWGNFGGGAIGGVTFTFDQPTLAFGFDWFNTDDNDQYQISFTPSGGPISGPPFTVAPFPAASTGFFGVISDTLLTGATITNLFDGGYISDEGFDNVRLGTAAVPEPSSLASVGVGVFFGLGYGWKRRRAKAA
jgi:hypothetical protein